MAAWGILESQSDSVMRASSHALRGVCAAISPSVWLPAIARSMASCHSAGVQACVPDLFICLVMAAGLVRVVAVTVVCAGMCAGQVAADAPEDLQSLAEFRQQHRKTIDGHLCAAAFVQER